MTDCLGSLRCASALARVVTLSGIGGGWNRWPPTGFDQSIPIDLIRRPRGGGGNIRIGREVLGSVAWISAWAVAAWSTLTVEGLVSPLCSRLMRAAYA